MTTKRSEDTHKAIVYEEIGELVLGIIGRKYNEKFCLDFAHGNYQETKAIWIPVDEVKKIVPQYSGKNIGFNISCISTDSRDSLNYYEGDINIKGSYENVFIPTNFLKELIELLNYKRKIESMTKRASNLLV